MWDERGRATLTFRRCLAQLIQLTGARTPEHSLEDRRWNATARQCLRAVFAERLSDPQWFEPLIHTAVYDPDPSHCRFFIEPALAAFGRRRVQEALITVLRDGTDAERSGAIRAWYWSFLPRRPKGSFYSAAPATSFDDDTLAERRVRWAETALHLFVINDNLDLRYHVVRTLTFHGIAYRPEFRPLAAEAAHIARTSPDKYLRTLAALIPSPEDPGQ